MSILRPDLRRLAPSSVSGVLPSCVLGLILLASSATAGSISVDYEQFMHREAGLALDGTSVVDMAFQSSVSGDFAYAVVSAPSDGLGLRVIDMTNTESPVEVGGLAVAATAVVSLGSDCVAVVEGSNVHFVDVSTPAAPTIANTVAVTGGINRLEVGDGGTASPQSLFALTGANGIAAISYAGGCGTGATVDVAPLPAELPGDVPAGMVARDDLVYLAFASISSIAVLDLDQIGLGTVSVVGYANEPFIPTDLAISGDRIVASSFFPGVDVFDINTPGVPVRVGGTGNFSGQFVEVDNTHAYVHDGAGLRTYSLTDLESPPRLAGDSSLRRTDILFEGYHETDALTSIVDVLLAKGGDPGAIHKLFGSRAAERLGARGGGSAYVEFVDVSNPATPASLDEEPAFFESKVAAYANDSGADLVALAQQSSVDYFSVNADGTLSLVSQLNGLSIPTSVTFTPTGTSLVGHGFQVDHVQVQPASVLSTAFPGFSPDDVGHYDVGGFAWSRAPGVRALASPGYDAGASTFQPGLVLDVLGSGSTLFVSEQNGPVTEVDGSDPDNLTVIAEHTFSENTSQLGWAGGDLLASAQGGSRIFRRNVSSGETWTLELPGSVIWDLASPPSGTTSRGGGSGRDLVYVATGGSVVVVDWTTPTTPKILGAYSEPGLIAVRLASLADEVFVFDQSGPRMLAIPGQVDDVAASVDPETPGTPGTPESGRPAGLALGLSAPNPFSTTVRIPFSLEQTAEVNLSVFDASGRLVRHLLDGSMPAGRHEVSWDGSGVGGSTVAGVYYVRLSAGTGTDVQKVVRMSVR